MQEKGPKATTTSSTALGTHARDLEHLEPEPWSAALPVQACALASSRCACVITFGF